MALAEQTPNLAKIPIGSNIEGRLASPTERQQARQVRGYGAADLVIGYFGFLNRSKGGLTLVRTLERLVRAGRNAQLLLIGEQVGVNDPTNFAYLQEVEALIEGSQPLEDRSTHGNEMAFIMYTGGTTGWPRGVMLSHSIITFAFMSFGLVCPYE